MCAGDQHQIQLTFSHRAFGHVRVVDAPARGHGHLRVLLDAASHWHEETRPPRRLAVQGGKADAGVDQVQAAVAHVAHQFDGFRVEGVVVAVILDHAKARGQRQMIRPDLAHGLHRFQQETAAILGVAPVLVGAHVGNRREEALRQVAMREVQFQPLETSGQRTLCRCHEIGLDAGDVVQVHGPRNLWQACAKCDRRGTDRRPPATVTVGNVVVTLPWLVGAGLAARMADLDAGHGASRADGCRDACHAFDLAVFPQTGASRRDAAFGRDTGGLDDHQARAATGHARVMSEVPFVHITLMGLVLAHGRNPDAVAQGDALQFEGRKKCGHCESLWFGRNEKWSVAVTDAPAPRGRRPPARPASLGGH